MALEHPNISNYFMKKKTIGLALGGGGARGAAHIGVLQVLHASGIRFDYITGTSAGAVIGAMYAATLDPEWIEQRFRDFIQSPEFEALGTGRMVEDRDPHSPFGQLAKKVRDQFVIVMSLNRSSIIKKEKFKAAMKFLIPVQEFEELRIPIDVTATDLHTGEIVVYSSGDLIEAVVQSGTIPGYIEPTLTEDKILVDGGVGLPNPVPLLKEKVDMSVAIDINKRIRKELTELNIYNILQRSEQITYNILTEHNVSEADVVIRPNVKGLHWSQFEEFDSILKNGQDAAEIMLPTVLLKMRKQQSWFARLKELVV